MTTWRAANTVMAAKQSSFGFSSAAAAGLTQAKPAPVELRLSRGAKKNAEYMCKGKLPVDVNGTAVLPHMPPRPLVVSFMADKRITDEILSEHFH